MRWTIGNSIWCLRCWRRQATIKSCRERISFSRTWCTFWPKIQLEAWCTSCDAFMTSCANEASIASRLTVSAIMRCTMRCSQTATTCARFCCMRESKSTLSTARDTHLCRCWWRAVAALSNNCSLWVLPWIRAKTCLSCWQIKAQIWTTGTLRRPGMKRTTSAQSWSIWCDTTCSRWKRCDRTSSNSSSLARTLKL